MKKNNGDVKSITDLLDRVNESLESESKVSLGDVTDKFGKRWLSPFLLIAGLVMLAPGVGDIPGVPIIMGFFVIVVCIQVVLKREEVWLPNWLKKCSISSKHVATTIKWLRKPAKLIDNWSKPRLKWAVKQASFYIIIITCILIALTTPLLELIPFSATVIGAAITLFGLALLFYDGAIAIIAIILSFGTLLFIIRQFF